MEPAEKALSAEEPLHLAFPSPDRPVVRARIVFEDGVAREAAEKLREEFERFRTPPEPGAVPISFSLLGRELPEELRTLGSPAFRTRMCQARGWRETRVCDYGQRSGCVTVESPSGRTFSVYAPDAVLLREIAQAALLSAVGESLDLCGFHRVHALGFRFRGRSGIVVLGSGGGKSSLAALMREDPECELFSDEMPLIRKGRVHAFPIRLALRPEVAARLSVPTAGASAFPRRAFPVKLHFPVPPEKVAPPTELDWIIVGKPAAGARAQQPSLRPSWRARSFGPLLAAMVVGIGLPQMSEYMLRGPLGRGATRIAWIALRRLGAATRLAARARAFEFNVTDDGLRNWAALRAFLEADGADSGD